MHKSIAILLLAAIAAASATHLMAAVIPPVGLAPGSQYQLIFVTAASIAGTFDTNAPYNAFVNSEAALSPTLPATTWHSVTSMYNLYDSATWTTPSGGDAHASPELPVYNTAGQLVSERGLYIPSSYVNPVGYDQYGGYFQTVVWTGTLPDGNSYAGHALGTSSQPALGRSDISASTLTWIPFYSADTLLPVYALSGLLTVPVPEPSTLVLACFAATWLTVSLLRRRNLRGPSDARA